MSSELRNYEEDSDPTLPFALFMIAYLREHSEVTMTDADRLALLRQCFAAYLMLNAGHYLHEGVLVLTNFIVTEFKPFTDGRIPPVAGSGAIAKYPITDTIAASCYPVPTDCFDLFISDDADVAELVRQLTEQGFVEPNESEGRDSNV